jgi:hypothetical protein
LIECSNDIQLSVKLDATQGVQGLADEWEQVLILNSDIVQSSVIMADSHISFWLGSKEEQGSSRQCGLLNKAFIKYFINPLLNTAEFSRGQWAVFVIQ